MSSSSCWQTDFRVQMTSIVFSVIYMPMNILSGVQRVLLRRTAIFSFLVKPVGYLEFRSVFYKLRHFPSVFNLIMSNYDILQLRRRNLTFSQRMGAHYGRLQFLLFIKYRLAGF